MREWGEWLGMVERREPETLLERLDSSFQLPYAQRMALFTVFLVAGVLFVIASTYMVFLPTTFGKYYTIGTLLILCSTFFLMGPVRQLQSMFHASRVWASLAFLLAIVLTL